MAKDDSLKKPKKIEVNRIMIFISSILIPFLWIDLYLVSKNTSKLMVVGIIAALILVWTGLLVTYIHRMKNEEKAHSDEQVEELLRTGKANYLMQKKLAEKIDNIGEKDAVPADEIITAQKAIAKLMGERSPYNNPNARATFIGMTMDTTRADMTQAVLEGVAFALRDSFEVAKTLGIPIERTKICGGGAKSPLWKKIIANVLNIKVDVLETEEGPSLGGAMLAAVACGEYKNVESAAAAIVKVVDTVEPDPELAAKYEARYQQFKNIYPACKDLFDKII